jgi:hypothetical protein
MASRSPQTHAKRARELAVKERRDRKRERKAEAAARRANGETAPEPDAAEADSEEPTAE